MPTVPHQNYPLTKGRSQISVFSQCSFVQEVMSSMDELIMYSRRWVRFHDLAMEELISFGLVITTEAHLAFSGARTHSNNTAAMTAMVEALFFLSVLVDQLTVMRIRAFFMTPNMLLVFAWARFRPAHMCSWRSHVNGPWIAPSTGCGSPCKMCTVTEEIWVMNVPTMPLHWGHGVLLLTTPWICKKKKWPFRVFWWLSQYQRGSGTFPAHQNQCNVASPNGSDCCVHNRVRSVLMCVSSSFLFHWWLFYMSSWFSKTSNGKAWFICLYRAEFRRWFLTQHVTLLQKCIWCYMRLHGHHSLSMEYIYVFAAPLLPLRHRDLQTFGTWCVLSLYDNCDCALSKVFQISHVCQCRWARNNVYTCSTNGYNQCHTALHVLAVRCGPDRRLMDGCFW